MHLAQYPRLDQNWRKEASAKQSVGGNTGVKPGTLMAGCKNLKPVPKIHDWFKYC
jgi:hypothetical protein